MKINDKLSKNICLKVPVKILKFQRKNEFLLYNIEEDGTDYAEDNRKIKRNF